MPSFFWRNGMRSKTGIFILFACLLAICSLWFYFTPHRAVDTMRAAAEARNAAVLTEYVEYPALKTSLKENIHSLFSQNSHLREKNTDPFAAIGAAMAAAFIDPMIEKLVTPEGLSMMLQGGALQLDDRNESKKLSDSDFETSMGYESFDRFVVTVTGKLAPEETPIELIFSRHGLFSWKLSGVQFSE